MPLETAQMLSTTLNHYGLVSPYKPTHKNHPCTMWTKASRENFLWLCELGIQLCAEYTYRYGRVHACQQVIDVCRKHANACSFPAIAQTPFAMAMPGQYRDSDAVTAYRRYYCEAKRSLFKWTGRDTPDWARENYECEA